MNEETHIKNERNCTLMYEPDQLYVMLKILTEYPSAFSMIEQDLADLLEDEGLFDLERYEVTELGIDYLKKAAA